MAQHHESNIVRDEKGDLHFSDGEYVFKPPPFNMEVRQRRARAETIPFVFLHEGRPAPIPYEPPRFEFVLPVSGICSPAELAKDWNKPIEMNMVYKSVLPKEGEDDF